MSIPVMSATGEQSMSRKAKRLANKKPRVKNAKLKKS